MSTYSNSAREVEMPDGNVVVLHSAPTGGANTTSNIKKFKYDDNGHVTESTAADAEDLNLSGYSTPTTGTTAIGASDDVQTAIGKLDHQSHIDQTNILYGLQTGVKNLFDLKNADTTAVTNISTSKTDTALTVTTSGEKKWSHVAIPMELEAGTYHVLATISGRTADSSAITRFIVASGAGGTPELGGVTFTNNGTIDFQFTTTGGTVYLIPYPNYSATGYNATFTASDIMVCTKAAWDQEPNVYRSFALPNYDLTRLESEDRAALADEIDAGAKNKLSAQLTSGTYGHKEATWTLMKDCVGATVNGTVGGTWDDAYVFDKELTFNDQEYILVVQTSNNNLLALLFGNTSSDAPSNNQYPAGVYRYKGTITTSSRLTAKTGTYSNDTIKLMICTKAAFGVSQKFVPYRLPYSTLGKLKWKSYEIDLSSVTFTKSYGGLYYYDFSVSSDFSTILSVSINSFSNVENKGFTAIMNQESSKIGLTVYDATNPQTLLFSVGKIWILVLGFA